MKRAYYLIFFVAMLLLMLGCVKRVVGSIETYQLVNLPIGYTVNFDSLSSHNLVVTLKNDTPSVVGYQIRPLKGKYMYFQKRDVWAYSTSIMHQGESENLYPPNPLIILTDTPINQWLRFNFVIYGENFPFSYLNGGAPWAFDLDFWWTLEAYYDSLCTRYEWEIKIFPDGGYSLRERVYE